MALPVWERLRDLDCHALPRPATAAIPPERVLVIAPHGSYRSAPFIAAARKLGADIVIASEGQCSLASLHAQGLFINLQDTGAALKLILDEHRRRPFAALT